jgi:hypothetical protein
MDQDEKFAFKRWLKTATDQELQTTEVQLLAMRGRIKEPGALSDLRFIKRNLYQEIRARRELAAVINNQREK